MIGHDPVLALPRQAAAAPESGRDALGRLVRAALAPVICAVVLLGLLSGWVVTGGAGTISRISIEVSSASVAMPAGGGTRALGYLVLVNLGGADELLSVTAPGARRAELIRHDGSAAGSGHVVRGLAIPAHARLTLSPFGGDITLIGPGQLAPGETIPLTLRFRHAGRLTVDATVTPPGTP
ncbi:MAG: copper chaperone PCu(A)C [Streptosporangiaceae bacterium]|jgi:copper(I)-binding protein